MKANRSSKNKRLLQGMGIGYIICLITHIIAALIPIYLVFPFAERFLGHGHLHGCCHSYGAYSQTQGLMNHILGDIMVLTMIIIPVSLLTWAGHKLVKYIRCRCGTVHENDPCETCQHRKY